MHTAQFVHEAGHRMALLDEKKSYLRSDLFTDREKIALRYCDAIMENPLEADDALWALLRAEFTEPELVELGHWIGFISGGQRWLITLHTRHGELAEFLARREPEKARGAAGVTPSG